jgi:shikimate kinase
MGSGKTSFGKRLAKILNLPFIDTDREVSRAHGPIPEIFEKHGESYFRDLEAESLAAAMGKPCIVATGGGAVLRESNQALLADAFVIYLRTNYEAVVGRLDIERRPLLKKSPEAWQAIFQERKHLYEGLADAIVDTAGRHADTVIAELESIAGGLS